MVGTPNPPAPVATRSGFRFGLLSLLLGALAVLLAIIATPIAAALEARDWLEYATSLWDADIAKTRSHGWLRLIYAALGLLAMISALIETLLRRMDWVARLGLILGIVALTWKWVLWGILAAVALAIVLNIS
jgi:hypothetical protein